MSSQRCGGECKSQCSHWTWHSSEAPPGHRPGHTVSGSEGGSTLAGREGVAGRRLAAAGAAVDEVQRLISRLAVLLSAWQHKGNMNPVPDAAHSQNEEIPNPVE